MRCTGIFLFSLLGICIPVQALESPASARNLRCEYRVDPLGIDVVEPRLFWDMHDPRRGAKQTAYQVLVASTPENLSDDCGDLWDSGKVESDQSIHVVYAGKPLRSRMRCFWKVRLWDAAGKPTPYSQSAFWSMGLLTPEDIKAKWIGLNRPMIHPAQVKMPLMTFDGCAWMGAAEAGVDPRKEAPAGNRFFRCILVIPEGRAVRRAGFLIAGDDAPTLFLNQRPLVFEGAGAWTAPLMIDVTSYLIPGKNCLAASIGNASVSPTGLIGKLVIEFEQGEPMVHCIDASWKASFLSEANWQSAEYDDSKWPAAIKIAKYGDAPWGRLTAAPFVTPQACPLFRKEFQLRGTVRRAVVYGSALGNYRLYINGKPVGDDYFTPDWTDYKKRVYYNTYDVTNLIRSNGTNAIGAVLAGGWYAGVIGYSYRRFCYGDRPRLYAQLEIEMADGAMQTIVTDGSWKTTFGPHIEGEFLAGETYDANQEISGWAEAGLNDGVWWPVDVTESISADLQAFPGVTIQETGILKPVAITEPKPGVYVLDMGQNFAGFIRLKAEGPAGTKVVLRYAEVLNPDGTIYTANLRTARVIDTYVLKGKGFEVWQPRFTYHGFRYVEVAGYPGKLSKDAITGVAIHSNTPLAGSFECSDPMVNRLYQNIVWTQRANFMSVPTDCPQRDERLGWAGDVQTFVHAAAYNADVAAFFTKWLVDLEDAQGPDGSLPDLAPPVENQQGVPAWADAGTVCPWAVYQFYNDRRLLEKHYGMMVRWVEYCRTNSTDLLRPATGYGDWLSINADTPLDVLATAYFAYSTRLTAEAARALGKKDDARQYDELFQQIKAAFNRAYVAPDGQIKGNTQTCYALALWFDLLPEQKRTAAVRYLVDDIRSCNMHLSTGFVGTSILMPTLSVAGNTPIAYKLLLNDTFPSWGFSIRHGATSIWERWDGWTPEKGFQDPGMNSFAHYSFGAVARWMFQTVAGIDTAEPGFQRLRIRPKPTVGLSWVKAGYNSIHGPIATEWRTDGEKLTLDVTIPANTTATVYLPVGDPARILESKKPVSRAEGVKFLRTENGESLFEITAGKYQFAMPWKTEISQ